MRPSDFRKNAPGRLVKTTGGIWSFIPEPLAPEVEWTDELVTAVSAADRALGRLAGIGGLLPNPNLLIGPFSRREAVLSSRIEGTRTTVGELLLYEAAGEAAAPEAPPAGREDAREVANYVRALQGGLRAVAAGMPLGPSLIRQMHAELMSGVRGGDKSPGAWRTRQVFIASDGVPAARARFVPPPPEALPDCLDALAKYIARPGPLPVLVRTALVHYQFETIHPFNDGNGRIGRLLITLMLCAEGVLPQPLLYLSDYFERTRRKYYDGLLAVSRTGAWSGWLTYFLRGVERQAADSVRRASELLALRDEFRARCQAALSGKALTLLDRLFAFPVISVQDAAAAMGITRQGAQKIVNQLVALKVLRPADAGLRKRLFVADRLVQALEAPAADDA